MGKIGKKIKKFLVGEKVKPPERVVVGGEEGGKKRARERERGKTAAKEGAERTDTLRGQVAEGGAFAERGSADVESSRTQLQQQRQLTAALTGAVGDSGSLAALQAKQAQDAARGQLAAGQATGGDLAGLLQAGAQQGLGLAGQAGQAAGQEFIGQEGQLAQLTAQQRGADLQQQGLGQSLGLGGLQNALAGQSQLVGAANSREDLARTAVFERQKLQLLADLRIRQAAQKQPQRGGFLPGILGAGGAILGGIFGGGAKGAKVGATAGEGLGTAFTAGSNQR